MTGGLVVRTVVQVTVLALAAVLTVVLARDPAAGAFAATTADDGNAVAAAADFCTAPGSVTVTAAGDSWIDDTNTGVNHGSDTDLYVRSGSTANLRTLVRFTLPVRPAGCLLSGATLRVYNRSPVSGRTIDVYRGDPAAPQWSSSTVTWANQPPSVGTAVGSTTATTAGWQNWSVLAHVQAQYTDGNNGFVLRDRTEGSSAGHEQVYYDLQNSTYGPRLVLTWS